MNIVIKTLFAYLLLINCTSFQKNLEKKGVETDGLELLIENDSIFYSWNNELFFNTPQTIKYKLVNSSNKNYVFPFNSNEIIIKIDSNNIFDKKMKINKNQNYKPKMILSQNDVEINPNMLLSNSSFKSDKNKADIQFTEILELNSRNTIHFSSDIVLPDSKINRFYEIGDSIYDLDYSYVIYLIDDYEFSLEIDIDSSWYHSLSKKDIETMRINNQTPFVGVLKSNEIPIKLIEREVK